MEKAFKIGVDVNAGIGPQKWDPPFDDYVFEARLSSGNASQEDLAKLTLAQSLVLTKLVRGRVAEVIGMSTGPFTVAPAIREFLETQEPGVHRFFPIQIKTSKPVDSKTEHGTHFLLYPPPPVDCLDFGRTVFNKDRKGIPWSRQRDDSRPWGGGYSPTRFRKRPARSRAR